MVYTCVQQTVWLDYCSLLMTVWTPWYLEVPRQLRSGKQADGGVRVCAVFSIMADYSNHSTTKKLQNISCYESQSCYPVDFGSVFICLLSEDPGNLSHLENSSLLLPTPKWRVGRDWWLCTCHQFIRGTEIQFRRNRTMIYHSLNWWKLCFMHFTYLFANLIYLDT